MPTHNRLLLAFLLTTLLLAACGATKTTNFAGTYTYDSNGKPAEIVRVTKTGDTWTIQAKAGNTWGDPQALHPATESEYATFLGGSWKDIVEDGLVNPNLAIFRIKPGSIVQGQAYPSGYVLVTMLGLIPVEQLPQQ
jgi:hypothetical protein